MLLLSGSGSGLLSLSIHEALTFEGTEIALHPDLFSGDHYGPRHPPGIHRPGASNSSLAANAKKQPSHERKLSDGTLSPAQTDHKDPKIPQDEIYQASVSDSNLSNRKLLGVGDMIEIKVWEPIKGAKAASPGTPSLMKRASSSELIHAAVSSDGNSGEIITQRRQSKTKTTLEAAASALGDPSNSISTAGSMQYSLDSPVRTPESTIHKRSWDPESDSSTSSPADRAKATSLAPSSMNSSPGREDSVPLGYSESEKGTDSHAQDTRTRTQAENQRPGKPPLVQRGSKAMNNLLPPEIKRSETKQSNKPAHFRDISDMTMETLVGSNLVGDVDLGIPSIDSQEEANADSDLLSRISSTHSLRLSFVMLVTEKSLASLKGQARSQISMLRQIADLYGLSPYDMVTVSRVDKADEKSFLDNVSADFVEVTIKDQFISRGEMHFFQKSLVGRWIYESERLSDVVQIGIRASAHEIRHRDTSIKSGIITEDTKITFRSRSARIIWLVQISSEMWDYACPYSVGTTMTEEDISELVFDKFVRFMHKLFKKWKELEVTHCLTVVFFCRTFISNSFGKGVSREGIFKDIYGRFYEDHYKTVVDNETPSDWDTLIARVKREFVSFPLDMGWNMSGEEQRRPSTAMQGNLLEAINVTLNLLQFHYFDRDLHRTGNSIVVVSPECGVFEVDKTLAGVTYQRMLDNGIGSDMLCLGLPPLHVAPFFLYNNVFHSLEGDGLATEKTYSEVPHWMNLSFVSYDISDSDLVVHREPHDRENGREKATTGGLRIGPNGFLLPDITPRTSIKLENVAFQSFSNLASQSMSKSQTQQRQLIAGRDFTDIIQACRPRMSSYSLPSPLLSLLRFQPLPTEPTEAGQNSGKRPLDGTSDRNRGAVGVPSRLHLREWGTVNFDDVDGLKLFSGGSNAAGSTSTRARSPVQGTDYCEKSESSDGKSSPSSSIASQLSNVLGRSADHRGTPAFSFLQVGQSPSIDISGFRIQRSPSLDDLELEASNQISEKKISEPNVDFFLQAMRKHDENVSRQPASTLISRRKVDHGAMVSTGREVNVSHETSSLDSSSHEVSGGLGAELLRYKTSGEVSHGTRDLPATKRIYSSGKLSIGSPTQFGAFLDMVPRGISPYMSMVGAKVGSDPPDFSAMPSQAVHAFARSSQSKRFKQESSSPSIHTGLISGSLEQRLGRHQTLSISAADSRQLGKSPPSYSKAAIPNISAAAVSSATGGKTSINANILRGRSRSRHAKAKGQKSVVNPFRQQDEDEELERKSHNRRRWSHVFPPGELEFKRHSGPLWKSLCQPAILPLTIDYVPSPQELENVQEYRFNPYQLTLQGMEHTHYSSHEEFLMEMVRQRITQDFQEVPLSVLKASSLFSQGELHHCLSMGHQIHILAYDSQFDSINVKLYTAITEEDPPIEYSYFMYSPYSKSYRRILQTFEKYRQVNRWNRLDHVLLEESDKALPEGMRFRRLQYGLIPPEFENDASELEYIGQFKRLLDYLGKLRERDESRRDLEIRIRTRNEESPIRQKSLLSLRRGTTEEMKRFTINLRKGKRDRYEWMEVSLDSVFETTRTYRIMFNWLFGSTSKVEGQVQSIKRKCAQFGLDLLSFPQTCVSRDLFLNPFVVPEICPICRPGKAETIRAFLLSQGFMDDGIHMTEPSFMHSLEQMSEFEFPTQRTNKQVRAIAGQQYVHRKTGAVFTRLIQDEQTWSILVIILNHRILQEKEVVRSATASIVSAVRNFAIAISGEQIEDLI